MKSEDRDVMSMERTRNIIKFRTIVSPLFNSLRLKYVIKEELEFEDEHEATIYFSTVGASELSATHFNNQKVGINRESPKKQLDLCDIRNRFSEEQMKKAWDDGAKAEQQRCGCFDIENY